ncbi:hypothetical protein U1Q18_026644 [Sarracenia purpurea var. burkii]
MDNFKEKSNQQDTNPDGKRGMKKTHRAWGKPGTLALADEDLGYLMCGGGTLAGRFGEDRMGSCMTIVHWSNVWGWGAYYHDHELAKVVAVAPKAVTCPASDPGSDNSYWGRCIP